MAESQQLGAWSRRKEAGLLRDCPQREVSRPVPRYQGHKMCVAKQQRRAKIPGSVVHALIIMQNEARCVLRMCVVRVRDCRPRESMPVSRGNRFQGGL